MQYKGQLFEYKHPLLFGAILHAFLHGQVATIWGHLSTPGLLAL
jgi:hypothetical protein